MPVWEIEDLTVWWCVDQQLRSQNDITVISTLPPSPGLSQPVQISTRGTGKTGAVFFKKNDDPEKGSSFAHQNRR
ncbi:hypothetical protein THS27_16440 [Thalassospira sp. MCCC 1A01428]|nr:hypothetical protein THS27_16440 [Thalassospira sp. MCCC 1A01428]